MQTTNVRRMTTRIGRLCLVGLVAAMAFFPDAGADSRGRPPGAAAADEAARPAEVELANEQLRVVVNPAKGAGIMACAVKRRGEWVDVMPDARKPATKMRFSSWLMLPYANRIRDGKFSFEGREYALENAKNHAIHGDGRNRAWKVLEQTPTSLKLGLNSTDFADFNWPWPIEAEYEFVLDGDRFIQRLHLVNKGETTMPAGFGWHPYYLRELTSPGEPALLQLNFSGIYPDDDHDGLPDGPAAAPPADLSYSTAKEIPRGRLIDACCRGYDGKGSIEWPESGVKLFYECSPNVTHVDYFNPDDRPVFALEPTANARDGVNLLARGDSGTGVIPLKAGEAIEASFALRVEVR